MWGSGCCSSTLTSAALKGLRRPLRPGNRDHYRQAVRDFEGAAYRDAGESFTSQNDPGSSAIPRGGDGEVRLKDSRQTGGQAEETGNHVNGARCWVVAKPEGEEG